MRYGKSPQNHLIGSSSTDENYDMLTILLLHECHTTLHVK